MVLSYSGKVNPVIPCLIILPELKRIASNQIVLLILFVTPIVLLFILFAEPKVGKVQAKRLEEDLKEP